MSAWRRIAIQRLPKHRRAIQESKSVCELFVALDNHFTSAHREPIDEQTIRGFYEFAWWAVAVSGNDQIRSEAANGFFEDLPKDKRVRELLPCYMTREQFLEMVKIFGYDLTPEEHSEFVQDFLKRREALQRGRK